MAPEASVFSDLRGKAESMKQKIQARIEQSSEKHRRNQQRPIQATTYPLPDEEQLQFETPQPSYTYESNIPNETGDQQPQPTMMDAASLLSLDSAAPQPSTGNPTVSLLFDVPQSTPAPEEAAPKQAPRSAEPSLLDIALGNAPGPTHVRTTEELLGNISSTQPAAPQPQEPDLLSMLDRLPSPPPAHADLISTPSPQESAPAPAKQSVPARPAPEPVVTIPPPTRPPHPEKVATRPQSQGTSPLTHATSQPDITAGFFAAPGPAPVPTEQPPMPAPRPHIIAESEEGIHAFVSTPPPRPASAVPQAAPDLLDLRSVPVVATPIPAPEPVPRSRIQSPPPPPPEPTQELKTVLEELEALKAQYAEVREERDSLKAAVNAKGSVAAVRMELNNAHMESESLRTKLRAAQETLRRTEQKLEQLQDEQKRQSANTEAQTAAQVDRRRFRRAGTRILLQAGLEAEKAREVMALLEENMQTQYLQEQLDGAGVLETPIRLCL